MRAIPSGPARAQKRARESKENEKGCKRRKKKYAKKESYLEGR